MVQFPLVLEPPVDMLASRVTVSPVDDSPFVVPLILTKKFQSITLIDILNPSAFNAVLANKLS